MQLARRTAECLYEQCCGQGEPDQPAYRRCMEQEQRDDPTAAEAAAELNLTEPELISLVRRVGCAA